MKNIVKRYYASVGGITLVDVIEETNWFVTTPGGERKLKVGDCQGYFPTWEEARDFIEKAAIADVEREKRHLDYYTKHLAAVRAMTPPEDGGENS